MKKLIVTLISVLLIFSSTVNAAALDIRLPKKGDADMDGEITAADARLILRCSVGLENPPVAARLLYYDADGDLKITAADARTVLRRAVGLDDTPQETATAEDNAKKISGMVSEAELDRLMAELCGMGSRSVFYPKVNKRAAEYISDELKKAGLSPEMQNFTYNGIETQNVTAVLSEGGADNGILLLSSHYDCWDRSEGAIDNASGVAALLHTAKLLKESSVSFNKEIRIAFFSAEEMGYFGAYHYISTLSENERSRLSVFNIDMAGNSALGGGKILTVSTNSEYVGGAKSNEVSRATDKAKSFLGNIGEEGYYSAVSAGKHDIVPFEKAGIPAATLSWREIRPEGAGYSDYGLASPSQIHTTLDTYGNFNISSLTATTRLVVSTLILSYTK